MFQVTVKMVHYNIVMCANCGKCKAKIVFKVFTQTKSNVIHADKT